MNRVKQLAAQGRKNNAGTTRPNQRSIFPQLAEKKADRPPANSTAQSTNEAAEKAVKNSKKAQKKTKSIYSEFVWILGIFTAMSFAMMGSVEILGNLFSASLL
ncbi:hypothetical protein [Lactobacillus delbrueckii]|uniref:hypothetical protein n=1 Tax=Lactobacillus delbrueckii TaxID=1584 RepID=UPI0021A36483|nr:hypothetical protein [Lactobacillus delbrueckii]